MHQSGEIINQRYRVQNIIGKGGVGITYSAVDTQTNSVVAIKAVSLKQLNDWKQVELFEREAEVLAKLDHPNIPKYLDYFDLETAKDKVFYIVQQLAPGKSLFQLVRDGWRTTEAEVKQIAAQILAILNYLHSLKPPVIHRDIKPQNLIMDESGKVYLVDFGAVQNTYYDTLMQGSTVVGTYGYMAPEQFRSIAVPATDLYGLGATLLFLLTHRSPAELPQNALKLDFRSQVNVSEAFVEWLEKILEPDAEDRFRSAKQALSFLSNQQYFVNKKRLVNIVTAVRQKAIIGFSLGVPIICGLLFNFHKHEILMQSNIYREKLCSETKLIQKYIEQDRELNISLEINGKMKPFLDCIIGQTDTELIKLLQARQSKIEDEKKYDKILIFYHIFHNNSKQVNDLTKKQDNIDIKYFKDSEPARGNKKYAGRYYPTSYFCQESSLLNEAIYNNSLEIVKILVKNGANINDKCSVYDANQKNRDKILTPLSKAIYLDNRQITKFLLEQKINHYFEDMPITLSKVIHENNTELLEVLLRNGLNPEYVYESDFLIKEVNRISNSSQTPALEMKRYPKEVKIYKYNSLLDFAKRKNKQKILQLFDKYKNK